MVKRIDRDSAEFYCEPEILLALEPAGESLPVSAECRSKLKKNECGDSDLSRPALTTSSIRYFLKYSRIEQIIDRLWRNNLLFHQLA